MQDATPDDTTATHDAPPEGTGDVLETLRARLKEVRERIAEAARAVDRRPESVTLVAVSKYANPEQIRAAIKLGIQDFGENYVQNLQQRATQFNEAHARLRQQSVEGIADSLRWHMIGHLQRNKVKMLLPHVTMVQTVDSLRLAEELDSQVPKLLGRGNRLPVLMQINCSGESQKSGVAVGAAQHLAEQIADMPHLRLMGVMTMARLEDTPEEARVTYARCREIFEDIRKLNIGGDDFRHLSMGMSQDYDAAVLEGATIVRVGSALFGGQESGEETPADA
jgi:pyridoxal phosphate enzyme (YggS family)